MVRGERYQGGRPVGRGKSMGYCSTRIGRLVTSHTLAPGGGLGVRCQRGVRDSTGLLITEEVLNPLDWEEVLNPDGLTVKI